jgi:hypothetical protein
VIGHITLEELRRELSATDKANGFGNRILWAVSRRSKLLPNGGALMPDGLADVIDGFAKAVRFGQSHDQEIRRDAAAGELWAHIYPRLTSGRGGMYGAITGRAEAQAMRLAMIYALLDRSRVITEQHLRSGLEVWRYCDDSARHIFAGKTGSKTADRIYTALVTAGDDGLSRAAIQNDVFYRHGDPVEIEAALSELAAAGKAEQRIEATAGRSREVWTTARKARKASEDADNSLFSHNSQLNGAVE